MAMRTVASEPPFALRISRHARRNRQPVMTADSDDRQVADIYADGMAGARALLFVAAAVVTTGLTACNSAGKFRGDAPESRPAVVLSFPSEGQVVDGKELTASGTVTPPDARVGVELIDAQPGGDSATQTTATQGRWRVLLPIRGRELEKTLIVYPIVLEALEEPGPRFAPSPAKPDSVRVKIRAPDVFRAASRCRRRPAQRPPGCA